MLCKPFLIGVLIFVFTWLSSSLNLENIVSDTAICIHSHILKLLLKRTDPSTCQMKLSLLLSKLLSDSFYRCLKVYDLDIPLLHLLMYAFSLSLPLSLLSRHLQPELPLKFRFLLSFLLAFIILFSSDIFASSLLLWFLKELIEEPEAIK